MSGTHRTAVPQPNRWLFPLAVLTAVGMLVIWFPLTGLWHQQSQLDSLSNQIATLQQQQRALDQQSKLISSKAAATQLARQEYQLVAPGQSLIQVLPGRQSGAAGNGDPGFDPLVAPSSASNLVTTTAHRASTSRSFFSRLLRTLEFWR